MSKLKTTALTVLTVVLLVLTKDLPIIGDVSAISLAVLGQVTSVVLEYGSLSFGVIGGAILAIKHIG